MSGSRRAWVAGPAALALLSLLAGLTVSHAPRRAPAAQRTAEHCTGTSVADFDCHRRYYEIVVRTKGAAAALTRLAADQDRDEVVRSTCHALAHAIAHAEVRGPAASPPPPGLEHLCGSGYDTGRVEALVAGSGSGRGLSRPDAVCAVLRRRAPRSNEHHNCVHALGHGLMQLARGDLPAALRGCDRLADPWERHRCFGGVFMDNITGSARRPASRHAGRDTLLHPCTAVARRYRSACYRQQPSYVLVERGGDFGLVFRLCAGLGERRFRRACYQGLGVDVAAQSMADHITDAGAAAGTNVVCDTGAGVEARSNCIVGAARQFVDHHRDQRAVQALCDPLAAAMRALCRRTGRAYAATLNHAPGVAAGWGDHESALLCDLPRASLS